MIVLDTNVISELMRAEPNTAVLAWVAAQPRALLYTTHINQAEILYGIGALPEGRRRTALAAAAAGRILPFEATAAARYADIVVARRQAGNPIEGFDALIAATAPGVGASVATRDTAGFAGCGLTLAAPLAGESLDGCQVAWARRLDAG